MLPAEPPAAAPVAAGRAAVDAHELRTLDAGWTAAACPPGETAELADLDRLDWIPARVPGTAAAALEAAGRWRPGEPCDVDGQEWWFRTRFAAEPAAPGEQVLLRLDGIATVAEVFLDGEPLIESTSMFARHAVDVSARIGGNHELAIRCRALRPLLQGRRKPRARWRTRVVADGNLRFFRTAVLGRAPGFAPGPAPAGPWRPVLLERGRLLAVETLALRPRLDLAAAAGGAPEPDGVLSVDVSLRSLGAGRVERAEIELTGPHGVARGELTVTSPDGRGAAEALRLHGEVRIRRVARWWPHTHGEPVLHRASLRVRTGEGEVAVDAGTVGFRDLRAGADPGHAVERDGIDLHVNGVRVFARGVVWTPADAVGLAPEAAPLRAALEQLRDAGVNMVRIPGIGVYESAAFHDLCDELGLLVWQDFMFANLDYPVADPDFRALVEAEAATVLSELAGRPSVAVLCGSSEVEQQVAMLGLDPALGRGELFGELLPAAVERADCDAIWVPSAPCGGTLPFRPDRGVANYYGVGGYRRPLEDARRAGVRFAAECLAFANVPDAAGIAAVLPGAPADVVVHHPRWKAGVPRDAGSGWDFEDVRDHYLSVLFGVDPGELRRTDHGRYLELSRAVSGEAMAEVFGEWRRPASTCGGGLVLWGRDLAPGAGWGVVDHAGVPKEAYHHLRRAFAPIAVWTTDEGLNGIAVHVANDRPEPLSARLRVTLVRDGEQVVDSAEEELELAGHGALERDVEGLLGRFADVGWAYRFGPPPVHAVVATLFDAAGGQLAQTFRFPAGRPLAQEPAARLGLRAAVVERSAAGATVRISSRRLAYGVRIDAPGYARSDDAFSIAPGGERLVRLRATALAGELSGATVGALNLDGRVRIASEDS
jgi:beta-mannosidase